MTMIKSSLRQRVEEWLHEYGPSLPLQRDDLLAATKDPDRHTFYESVVEGRDLVITPTHLACDEGGNWVLRLPIYRIPEFRRLVTEITFLVQDEEDPWVA